MPSETRPTIFLSYSGDDSLEAGLLQYAIEHELQDLRTRVWTYERDQRRNESDKAKVRSILTHLQKQAPSRLDIANVQGQGSTRLDLRNTIQNQIAKSDEVVVLWTKDGAASGFVNYEAAMADAVDKPITVILTDRTAPKLPEALQGASVLRLGDAVKAGPRAGRRPTVRARPARTVRKAPVKKRRRRPPRSAALGVLAGSFLLPPA